MTEILSPPKFRVNSSNDSWTAVFLPEKINGIDTGFSSGNGVWEYVRILQRSDTANSFPRILAANVRASQVSVKIPGNNCSLELFFTDQAPLIELVMDNPAALFPNNLLATNLSLEIPVSNTGKWPAWINLTTSFIRNEKGEKVSVSSAWTLLKNFLKLVPDEKTNTIIINQDGLAVKAKMAVPWNTDTILPGFFRVEYLSVNGVQSFSLLISEDSAWTENLRTFQDDVIDASNEKHWKSGIPQYDSPSAGLIASDIEDEIRWRYTSSSLDYDPGKSIFELELRGAGRGTCRIPPGKVQISQNGTLVIIESGTAGKPGSDNFLYEFEPALSINKWSGLIGIVPEEQSLQGVLGSEAYSSLTAADDLKLWIITRTGHLQLSPGKISEIPKGSTDSLVTTESLLRGIFRLSVVPWQIANDQKLANPEVSKGRAGSILLSNAKYIRAEFRFTNNASGWNCQSIKLTIENPNLMIEDLLSIYLPPADHPLASSRPPAWPKPGDRSVHFTHLSFMNDATNPMRWKYQLDYSPGSKTESDLTEGNWGATSIECTYSESRNKKQIYWYQPPHSGLLPALPYHGDAIGEEGVSYARVLFPLIPVPEKAFRLQLGDSRLTPVLYSGTFSIPDTDENNLFYKWAHILLPGIAVGLQKGDQLQIEKGKPVAGDVHWEWHNEIPIQDEFRVLSDNSKKEPDPTDMTSAGPAWWRQLEIRSKIATTKNEFLTGGKAKSTNGNLLDCKAAAIQIGNLAGPKSFAGLASIDLLSIKASLRIADAKGQTISLIEENDLLKGPTAFFEVKTKTEPAYPDLFPVAKKTETALLAGSMPPFPVKFGSDLFYADQNGNLISALNLQSIRRVLQLPFASGYQSWILWSNDTEKIITGGFTADFWFREIPFTMNAENTAWKFSNLAEGNKHISLREYRWGLNSAIELSGIRFQVFSVDELVLDKNSATLIKLTVSGVLHFRDSHIQKADPAKQKVTVTCIRENGKWKLSGISGSVFWPLLCAAPDLSITKTIEATDIYPLIESTVSLKNNSIAWGEPGKPAKFVFHFLNRRWAIPIEAVANETPVGNTGLQEIRWKISSPVSVNGLFVNDGMIYQRKDGSIQSSWLSFSLEIRMKESPDTILAVLFFKTNPLDPGRKIQLTEARFFPRKEQIPLVIVTDPEFLQMNVSGDGISIALNLDGTQRKNTAAFDWLPGWSIPEASDIHLFLGLSFEKTISGQRIPFLPIDALQLTMETAVSTPGLLKSTINYSFAGKKTPELELKFSGTLTLNNELSWLLASGEKVTHRLTAYLLDAILPGEQLTVSVPGRSLFTLRKESPPIEIRAMGMHQLFAGSKQIAEWVAPLRLRLIHADTISRIYPEQTVFSDPGIRKRFAGFNGRMGNLLAEALKNSGTMLIDASEAYWLNAKESGTNKRKELIAWKDGNTILKAVPAAPSDFTVPASSEWCRVPFPFICDTSGTIRNARSKSAELDELFCNYFKILEQKTEKRISASGIDFQKYLDKGNGLHRKSVTYPWKQNGLSNDFSLLKTFPESASVLIRGKDSPEEMDKGLLVFERMIKGRLPAELPILPSNTPEKKPEKPDRKEYGTDPDHPVNFQYNAEEEGSYLLRFQLQKSNENSFCVVTISSGNTERVYLPYTGKEKKEITIELPVFFSAGNNGIKISPDEGTVRLNSASVTSGWESKFLRKVNAKSWSYGSITRIFSEQFPDCIFLDIKSSGNKTTGDWVSYDIDTPVDLDCFVTIKIAVTRSESQLTVKLGDETLANFSAHKKAKSYPTQWLTFTLKIKLGPSNNRLRIQAATKGVYVAAVEVICPEMSQIIYPAFASTWSAIEWLNSNAKDRDLLAATEILPSLDHRQASWNKAAANGENSFPFLQISPAIRLKIMQEETAAYEPGIALEYWLPAMTDGWQNASFPEMKLFSRKQFLVQINNANPWKLKFPVAETLDPAGLIEYKRMLKRISDWSETQYQAIPAGSEVLLRITASIPGKTEVLRNYFLPFNENDPELIFLPVELFSTTSLFVPDIHLEELPVITNDPLSAGPDYLAGKVYYCPDEWYIPALPPFAENQFGKITHFISSATEIISGEKIILSWGLELDEKLKASAYVSIRAQGSEEEEYPEGNSFEAEPTTSLVYVLSLYDSRSPGIILEEACVGIRVRVPVSGSAVGLSIKLSGTVAGPMHFSRLAGALKPNTFRRWVEMTRDILFNDYTRSDPGSAQETGWILPASRKLKWEAGESLSPVLPARALVLYTQGRAGSNVQMRTAFLAEDESHLLRRSGSTGHAWKHPRPVPLPEKLFPKAPGIPKQNEIPESCSVTELESVYPFRSRKIEWKDPLYDRKLLAVKNSIKDETSGISLILDRKIYGGFDFCYPEIQIDLNQVKDMNFRYELKIDIERKFGSGFETIPVADFTITANGVEEIPDCLLRKAYSLVYVIETGLNRSEETQFDIQGLQHNDRLKASMKISKDKTIYVSSIIRTDVEIWPPPQNAFAILRYPDISVQPEEPLLAAFGWFVRPYIVRRADIFIPGSWTGKFRFTDTFIVEKNGETLSETYEVRSFTPYGEQSMKPFKRKK